MGPKTGLVVLAAGFTCFGGCASQACDCGPGSINTVDVMTIMGALDTRVDTARQYPPPAYNVGLVIVSAWVDNGNRRGGVDFGPVAWSISSEPPPKSCFRARSRTRSATENTFTAWKTSRSAPTCGTPRTRSSHSTRLVSPSSSAARSAPRTAARDSPVSSRSRSLSRRHAEFVASSHAARYYGLPYKLTSLAHTLLWQASS